MVFVCFFCCCGGLGLCFVLFVDFLWLDGWLVGFWVGFFFGEKSKCKIQCLLQLFIFKAASSTFLSRLEVRSTEGV